jgi:uncharacterized protein (TIGR02117 family)
MRSRTRATGKPALDREVRHSRLWLALLIALCAGCAGAVHEPYPPAEGQAVRLVFVTDHGWHTGIVVHQADIPVGLWPTDRDFAGSEYVEVGWGDRDFYLAPQGTPWLALKAAIWSTSAVLHVVAFDGPPDRFFAGREVVALRISERGFRRLAEFVREAWATDASGRPIPLGPGPDPGSRFYLATGRYSLLRTCNTWTAAALRAAGLPINPTSMVTAGQLMNEARSVGTVIGGRRSQRASERANLARHLEEHAPAVGVLDDGDRLPAFSTQVVQLRLPGLDPGFFRTRTTHRHELVAPHRVSVSACSCGPRVRASASGIADARRFRPEEQGPR